MIGIVIVSHSAKLAEGVCELAAQMAQGGVRLSAAGGTDSPDNPLGTDAFKVARAVDSAYSDDGVLVLMDLGSAVLSAETALEMIGEERRPKVRLCAAPLVEGAVAAVGQALAGAGLDEIAREAERALEAKAAQLQPQAREQAPACGAAKTARVSNRLGLHARPAVRVVRAAGRFQARITVRNATRNRGPFEASSINGLLSLAARQGDELALDAAGPDAADALAELSALIENGFGEGDGAVAAPLAVRARAGSGELSGVAASRGIAIGPLRHYRAGTAAAARTSAPDPRREWHRLLEAIGEAEEETRHIGEWTRHEIGEDEAAIFDAQLLFLTDKGLRDRAAARVFGDGDAAAYAWQEAVRETSQRLKDLDDPYLRERAADVADAGDRVLTRLAGESETRPADCEGVVAARDLAPSQVANLDPEKTVGLCLEAGGANAHSIILARAMGIPAVVGVGPELASIPDGARVALDGDRGQLWIEPDAARVEELSRRRAAWMETRKAARASRQQPARTRDGRRIRVLANISGVEEARAAIEQGGEGVGVLRTEFLFLNRTTAPEEDEQFRAYSATAEALRGRPLVIRTLDAGGDKILPYVPHGDEENPFLGWRGIRVSLGRRDLFKTQLKAILRAAAAAEVEILLPMVASLDEIRAAREVLEQAKAELHAAGARFNGDVKLGAMIEVPAAALIADRLAREADFFSIGTNDLTQYVMAADRTNPRVSAIADPLQPPVLRMVGQVVAAAREANIGATLCGELAGDPLATAALIGLGLEEFSVSPPLIPEVKRAIACVTMAEAEEAAREALALDSSPAVRSYLSRRTP